mmetsp:Transcript_20812/g.44568  ORF Transcript_20812/g.44568 Transcript_20812/m.44568 type:complete len:81 (+) Transcript_20812:494-736(+)
MRSSWPGRTTKGRWTSRREKSIAATTKSRKEDDIRIAKLNREYNEMVEECEDEEPPGPLEATMKGPSKEIEQETTEIRAL